MKAKTLIIILVVLTALIGTVIFVSSWDKFKTKDNSVLLPSLDMESIDSITIKSGEAAEEFTIAKTDNVWKINDQEIDFDKLNSMINSFLFAKIEGPVSTKADNLEAFEISDNMGTSLSVKNNDTTILELVIGKSGSTPGTTYFRFKDSNEVYLVDQSLNSTIKKTVDDWLPEPTEESAETPTE
ncbi:MAG: DUF4340 domain-containing protein [bacterium]